MRCDKHCGEEFVLKKIKTIKRAFLRHLTNCVSLFALLLLSSQALAQDDCAWPSPDILAAVVPIAADDGSYASGVVVGHNRVLTAAHAVASEAQVYANIKNHFLPAQVLLRDAVNDLAILAVDTADISPLRLALGAPYMLQQVWAVGFPRAQAKTTSVGVLQRMSQGALHSTAPIDSGQSGGGLLLCNNGSYALAGMLRGYGAYLEGDEYIRLENHSVSVAAATIQRFVDLPYAFQ